MLRWCTEARNLCADELVTATTIHLNISKRTRAEKTDILETWCRSHHTKFISLPAPVSRASGMANVDLVNRYVHAYCRIPGGEFMPVAI